jgi:hypothetical protein
MGVPGSAAALLFGQSEDSSYEISRSLRFNSADSAYLNRTPSSAGNRRTWTISFWIKRVKFGGYTPLLDARNPLNDSLISLLFNSNDELELGHYSFSSIKTSRKYRDPSAWYHIVLAVDTTQGTASNRIKVYTNGVQEDSFTTSSYPSQNTEYNWNTASLHTINQASSSYGDQYFADVYCIDGQALAPTDFGETDEFGVWQPKEFEGTYSGAVNATGALSLYNTEADTTTKSSPATFRTDPLANNLQVAVAGDNSDEVSDHIRGSGSALALTSSSCTFNQTGKFYSDAFLISGTGGHCTVAESTNAKPGTADFCVEFWINPVALPSNAGLMSYGTYASAGAFGLMTNGNGRVRLDIGGYTSLTVNGGLTTNWQHFALTRSGTTCTLYIDGVSRGTITVAANHNFTPTNPYFVIGNRLGLPFSSYNINSYFQDFRVYVGTSKYSNNFVLPGFAGANSFHLDFADNSSNAALGTDTSGNSNTWTVNNLSANEVDYAATGTVSSATGATTGPVSRIFDGDLNPNNASYFSVQSSGSHTGTITFSPKLPAGTTIELFGWKGTSASSGVVEVNGTDVSSAISPQYNSPPTWGNVSSAASGGIETIKLYRQDGVQNPAIAGVRVDGVVLVSGTPSNTDSLVDSPTNGTQTDTGAGGEVVGNYATLNPLHQLATATLTNGNLQTTSSNPAFSTFLLKSGKWYCEHTVTATGYNLCFSQIDHPSGATPSSSNSKSIGWYTNGTLYWQGGSVSAGASYGIGDVLGAAIDMDNTTITLYKNGTQATSINFSSGYHSTFAEGMYVSQFNGTGHFNFGQRAFAHTAPSGYKSLNTANLPEPTIADGSKYFDTKLYTSTGADLAVTGLQFSPDFVWVKNRQTANHHGLFDIVRGPNKFLQSNRSNAESTTSGSGYGTGTFNSFDANGFTVGSDVGANVTNYPSGQPHVAWAWDGGTSTVSNTDGSITSQVRANPSAGFSIVTYTGTGSSASIGHGLNDKPRFVIVKSRSNGYSWIVWHGSFVTASNTDNLFLSATGARGDYNYDFWNNTAPTSSVVNLGTQASVNASGATYVSYCFAPVEGYSAMGSYVGNGSADGPFVYTGFRPAFVLTKVTSRTGTWLIWDTKRGPYNTTKNTLSAETSASESTAYYDLDILSNGFKIRNGYTAVNSTHTYVYAAFAENPFKTARAR